MGRGTWWTIAGAVLGLVAAAVAFTVPASISSAAPGDPVTVVVRARGTLAQGAGPIMSVRVGGDATGVTPVQATVDNAAFVDFTFTVPEPATATTVDVAFSNDLFDDPDDRNLIIESVTIDGTTTLPTDTGVTIDRGAGEDAFDGIDVIAGQSTLYWDAALRVPYDPTADPGDPPTGVLRTIVVEAAGTPAGGVWPEMSVRVGGQAASPASVTVDNSSVQAISFTTDNYSDGATLDVVFSNDAWLPPEDRNLIVRSITVGTQRYLPTDPGVVIDRGSGADAFDDDDIVPGQSTMWWNGALRLILEPEEPTGVTGNVTVRARGTDALNVWPQMSVLVNGQATDPGSIEVSTASYVDFVVATDNLTDEPLVDVVFTNDGAGGGRDRNLFVDSIVVNGRFIESVDERVTYDRGSGLAAFDGLDTEPGRFSMYVDGSLRFDARDVAPVVAQPPRAPLATELVYTQDFAAGAVDAENWWLYDSPGNSGWGLRRPSAISVTADPTAQGGHLLTFTADMGTGAEAGQLVSGGMMLRVDQTYGRYTVRIRTEPDPDLATTGVALLWPVSQNWPEDGEIDFYETWRDRLSRTPVDLSLHDLIAAEHVVDGLTLVDGNGDMVDGSQWHTYQVDWRPDYLAVSVDGGTPQVLPMVDSLIPDEPMRLAIQLDGWDAEWAPGQQPVISQPVQMFVDWVTVERYPEFDTPDPGAGLTADPPTVQGTTIEPPEPPNRSRPHN